MTTGTYLAAEVPAFSPVINPERVPVTSKVLLGHHGQNARPPS